ncbi:MAG: hypothetical protein ACRCTE_13485 [Cellulosilyticaceae bacterium]
MLDRSLQEAFKEATESILSKVREDKSCIAAILIGSTSHDVVWEWSDLELVLIYKDSYTGPAHLCLLEQDVRVNLTLFTCSSLTKYLNSTDLSDVFYCALSKGTMLFCEDEEVEDLFEDAFYLGKREQEIEQLLGFANAVYYLNKVEKNLQVKGDVENAYYFMTFFNEGLAWLEVAKKGLLPEREIIKQGKALHPELFVKTYDSIIQAGLDVTIIHQALKDGEMYLRSETERVYRPIIAHLKTYGTIKDFKLPTRPHGFGINYEWLVRYGLAERYAEPITNNRQLKGLEKLGYQLKREYC